MAGMTPRERLTAIYGGRQPDRPAVKVWGLDPAQTCSDPAFEKVRDAGAAKTDLVLTAGSPFQMYAGRAAVDVIEKREEPTSSPDWVHRVTIYHTPEGDLRDVFRQSTRRRPGYEVEYMIKEPADLKKLLSLPYEAYAFDADGFGAMDRRVGDAGIVMFGLDHPMYGLQRLMGSERFALWSVDHEDLLMEAVGVFSRRVREHAREALRNGIRAPFAWVGPELCIPPLMPPSAFDKYVTAFDKPLVDMLHYAGCGVWVHCHGKMGPVIERFAEMGVDVLNPIEPPPMGDITMAEAFNRVGDRMALEGNIETHDLMVSPLEPLREKIHSALDAGRGKRMILCPSSGYMESVTPTEREIENWLLYVEEGVRYAEELAG